MKRIASWIALLSVSLLMVPLLALVNGPAKAFAKVSSLSEATPNNHTDRNNCTLCDQPTDDENSKKPNKSAGDNCTTCLARTN